MNKIEELENRLDEIDQKLELIFYAVTAIDDAHRYMAVRTWEDLYKNAKKDTGVDR